MRAHFSNVLPAPATPLSALPSPACATAAAATGGQDGWAAALACANLNVRPGPEASLTKLDPYADFDI